MKSAVFYEKNNIKTEELPLPTPKADEVLIKVYACGICGTDVHIFNGDEGAAKTPSGTVLGHEFAGEIVEIGSNATEFKIGDRVCVDPNKLCGECYYCKSGIGHFCENMIGIGTTINGGFSEYCVVPKSQVYNIGDAVSYEEAAMAEPVACCMHGIDLCDIECGSTIAIIGGGMIGLIMLQLAKLRGASTIILIEPVKEKYELAKKLGADILINPFEVDVKNELKKQGVNRIGTVIECVGNTKTIAQAIDIAGNYSTVMMFGLTAPNDEISIKPFEIFKKEITLKSSFINPYTQKRAIDTIKSGKIDVSSMVYSVEELDKLPEILANKEIRSKGKIIISPNK